MRKYIVILFLLISVNLFSATKYWVGGTGNWSDMAHWSTSSGGSGGSAAPTSTDDVIFDANSFSSDGNVVTIDATSVCGDLIMVDIDQTVTLSNTVYTLTSYGDVITFPVGGLLTISFSGSAKFTLYGHPILTSNGTVMNFNDLRSGSSSFIPVDDCDFGGTVVRWATGTFNTGGYTMTWGDYMPSNPMTTNFGSSTINAYSIQLQAGSTFNAGTSTINLRRAGGTVWSMGSTGTYTLTGSTIVMTEANQTANITFTGNGKTYSTVTLKSGNGFTTAITGANTFATLNLNQTGTGTATYTFPASTTNTITTALNTTGTTTDLFPIISSATAGTATTLALSGATTTSAYTAFKDITYTGTPTQSNTFLSDRGNNTGITFSTQDRYWVGGTESWNATSGSKWATTSGGTDYQIRPNLNDNVYFDATSDGDGSVVVTLSAAALCKDINFTGYTGTFTHNTSITLTIYGSATWVSGMTYTLGNATTSAVTFVSTASGKTFTSAGKTFGNLTFNGVGGGWTLQDNLTTSGTWTTTNGTPSFGNYVVTMNSASPTFAGNGINYGGTLAYGSTGETFTITGANTFDSLKYDGSALTSSVMLLSLSANQTVDHKLLLKGGADNRYRLLVYSSAKGTPRTITMTAGATKSMQRVDFIDITGSPSYSAHGDTWDLDSITGGSGNLGGNSEINFITGMKKFWHEGTGYFEDDSKWFTVTNGGGSATTSPLAQDTARFDGSSFDAGSRTVTLRSPRIGGIDFTGATNTPTFTFGISFSTYGSWTLISGMTLTPSSYKATFSDRRATCTLNSGGKSFYALTYSAYGGTLTLQTNNLTCTNNFTVSLGTFVDANLNITSGFDILTSVAVTGGSGLWKSTGYSAPFTLAPGTFNATSIEVTSSSSGDNSQVDFNSNTFNNVTISGIKRNTVCWRILSSFTVNGILTIAVDATANPGQRIFITKTKTITMGTSSSIVAAGTSGHLLLMDTVDGAGTWTITRPSGNQTFSLNWLDLHRSVATQANTFYAGANSTDGGGNTGWLFQNPPQIILSDF